MSAGSKHLFESTLSLNELHEHSRKTKRTRVQDGQDESDHEEPYIDSTSSGLVEQGTYDDSFDISPEDDVYKLNEMKRRSRSLSGSSLNCLLNLLNLPDDEIEITNDNQEFSQDWGFFVCLEPP